MKAYVTEDEIYPVFSLSHYKTSSLEHKIEISESLYADYLLVEELWTKVQAEINRIIYYPDEPSHY